MKKQLFITTIIATLSICALTSCQKKPVEEEYVDYIKEKLDIKEGDEYCYTSQIAQPAKDFSRIVEFYYFGPTSSISTWYCIKTNNKVGCDMLRIYYYN